MICQRITLFYLCLSETSIFMKSSAIVLTIYFL